MTNTKYLYLNNYIQQHKICKTQSIKHYTNTINNILINHKKDNSYLPYNECIILVII